MMWKRTYSSCCPWFLSRGQGCRGRTLLCFPCVSSHTPFPPDLYSVCDSLSHSLKKQTGTLTDAFPLKGSVHSKTKTTKSLSQVVSKKIHYIYIYILNILCRLIKTLTLKLKLHQVLGGLNERLIRDLKNRETERQSSLVL